MKIFENVARLEIGQLFTQSARRGHPCTLDTLLVPTVFRYITYLLTVLELSQLLSDTFL